MKVVAIVANNKKSSYKAKSNNKNIFQKYGTIATDSVSNQLLNIYYKGEDQMYQLFIDSLVAMIEEVYKKEATDNEQI